MHLRTNLPPGQRHSEIGLNYFGGAPGLHNRPADKEPLDCGVRVNLMILRMLRIKEYMRWCACISTWSCWRRSNQRQRLLWSILLLL